MIGFKTKKKKFYPISQKYQYFLYFVSLPGMELYPVLALNIHPVVRGRWLLPLQIESYHKGKFNFFNNVCKIPESKSDLKGLHCRPIPQPVAGYRGMWSAVIQGLSAWNRVQGGRTLSI